MREDSRAPLRRGRTELPAASALHGPEGRPQATDWRRWLPPLSGSFLCLVRVAASSIEPAVLGTPVPPPASPGAERSQGPRARAAARKRPELPARTLRLREPREARSAPGARVHERRVVGARSGGSRAAPWSSRPRAGATAQEAAPSGRQGQQAAHAAAATGVTTWRRNPVGRSARTSTEPTASSGVGSCTRLGGAPWPPRPRPAPGGMRQARENVPPPPPPRLRQRREGLAGRRTTAETQMWATGSWHPPPGSSGAPRTCPLLARSGAGGQWAWAAGHA